MRSTLLKLAEFAMVALAGAVLLAYLPYQAHSFEAFHLELVPFARVVLSAPVRYGASTLVAVMFAVGAWTGRHWLRRSGVAIGVVAIGAGVLAVAIELATIAHAVT